MELCLYASKSLTFSLAVITALSVSLSLCHTNSHTHTDTYTHSHTAHPHTHPHTHTHTLTHSVPIHTHPHTLQKCTSSTPASLALRSRMVASLRYFLSVSSRLEASSSARRPCSWSVLRWWVPSSSRRKCS